MILLGEFLTIVSGDQRQMQIAWSAQSQALHEPALASGIVEQVCAAYDFGHPGCGIIHNDGELIGIKPIPALEQDVTHLLVQLAALLAPQDVCERDAACHRRSQSPRHIGTGERNAINTACACADAARAEPVMCSGVIQNLMTGAPAGVEQITLHELLQGGFVVFGAWHLINDRAIPVQAVSLQTAEDGSTGTGFGPGRIQIFDTQKPFAALLSGADIAADSGQQGAGMQAPRRGRGEATND